MAHTWLLSYAIQVCFTVARNTFPVTAKLADFTNVCKKDWMFQVDLLILPKPVTRWLLAPVIVQVLAPAMVLVLTMSVPHPPPLGDVKSHERMCHPGGRVCYCDVLVWCAYSGCRSASLPSTVDLTVALRAFRSQRVLLLNLIRHCLPTLANSLLAQNLIHKDVYEKVCSDKNPSSERGGALLECLEDRIEAFPASLLKIVDILKSEPFLQEMADDLVHAYSK